MSASFDRNLMFFPLYMVYHDQWMFKTWTIRQGGLEEHNYPHRGHVHFFMLGHDVDSQGGQAYRGSQEYRFKLEDDWSSRVTTDPNQSQNTKVIGTPRWYFWIREFWRRVYVQKWDDRANDDTTTTLLGKLGLKYDASLPIHTHGPYRETRDNFFYMSHCARTLPIEYYRDENKMSRDHWLKTSPGKYPAYMWHWHPDHFDNETPWVIPRTYFAGHDNLACGAGEGPAEDDPARRFGYADSNYIYPTIEYQYVQHLNWERLPGFELRDIDSETFGDGFEIAIQIPFTIDGKIQSPFSDDTGTVGPPGSYYHDFTTLHQDRIPVYPSGNLYFAPIEEVISSASYPSGHNVYYDRSEWLIPAGLLGRNVEFHIPETLRSKQDGAWVEQCLGAIVKAKAMITIEDNFRGRYNVWVTGTQFMVQDNFAGTDQNEPA